MHQEVLDFVGDSLHHFEVAKKTVLEVGSYDFNGTVRPLFAAKNPAEYIGVDILEGPGVDIVCDASRLVDQFGKEHFDVVVTTEMLEHAHDWRSAVQQMKRVLKSGGHLVLTTRSIGADYHGYPYDFWRYELADMEAIFDDFEISDLRSDPSRPGVFLYARKPAPFNEQPLDDIALFSILLSRRVKNVGPAQEWLALKRIGFIRWYRQAFVRLRMTLWGLLPVALRRILKRTIFDRSS